MCASERFGGRYSWNFVIVIKTRPFPSLWIRYLRLIFFQVPVPLAPCCHCPGVFLFLKISEIFSFSLPMSLLTFGGLSLPFLRFLCRRSNTTSHLRCQLRHFSLFNLIGPLLLPNKQGPCGVHLLPCSLSWMCSS